MGQRGNFKGYLEIHKLSERKSIIYEICGVQLKWCSEDTELTLEERKDLKSI